MHTFDMETFLSDYHDLVSVAAVVYNVPDWQYRAFDLPGNQLHLKHAKSMLENIRRLGLSLSARTAESLVSHMENQSPWREIVQHIQNLHGRIGDELKGRFFLIVPADLVYAFTTTDIFGISLATKFPSASSEIAEAGKCLALGRSTASVFHLMRVMEIGLHAFRACLGIPDPVKGHDKNWGSILQKCVARLDQLDKNGSWKVPADKMLFRELYASIDGIKNAWRNNTMHVERTYSQDEAQYIFTLVKGFMQNIAARFDEHGDPKA